MPIKGRNLLLSRQNRNTKAIITNTAAVSFENKANNKHAATNMRYLTDWNLNSNQIAKIPKKKNRASSIDGIEYTTWELRGCIKNSSDNNKARTVLNEYLKNRNRIKALPK
jgi:hypothetical protein